MKLDELALSTLTEVSALIRTRQVSPVELTKAMLARIETVDPKLHSYALVTPDAGAQPGQGRGGRDRPGPLARAAAWHSHRPEGSLLHQGHSDGGRHDALCRLEAGRGRHGGRAAAARGRRAARQAADDRGRLRRSPSEGRSGRSIRGTPTIGPVRPRRARASPPPPGCASARSARIPAARSASPRP